MTSRHSPPQPTNHCSTGNVSPTRPDVSSEAQRKLKAWRGLNSDLEGRISVSAVLMGSFQCCSAIRAEPEVHGEPEHSTRLFKFWRVKTAIRRIANCSLPHYKTQSETKKGRLRAGGRNGWSDGERESVCVCWESNTAWWVPSITTRSPRSQVKTAPLTSTQTEKSQPGCVKMRSENMIQQTIRPPGWCLNCRLHQAFYLLYVRNNKATVLRDVKRQNLRGVLFS